MKKTVQAALLQSSVRKIRIRCNNQPHWHGIELSDKPHKVHRLGKACFVGLACDSVLEKIFPNDEDVIRVELTPEGAVIQAEGLPRISATEHSKRKDRDAPFLAPYDRRTFASLEGFTLRFERA